jgi:hypothetical protein
VKARCNCHVLQVKDSKAILQLAAVSGLSSVANVGKKQHIFTKLSTGQTFVSIHGGVTFLDAISLVNVNANAFPSEQKFPSMPMAIKRLTSYIFPIRNVYEFMCAIRNLECKMNYNS